jgi:hypothetical protein
VAVAGSDKGTRGFEFGRRNDGARPMTGQCIALVRFGRIEGTCVTDRLSSQAHPYARSLCKAKCAEDAWRAITNGVGRGASCFYAPWAI